jgi:hypothetical protein
MKDMWAMEDLPLRAISKLFLLDFPGRGGKNPFKEEWETIPKPTSEAIQQNCQ